jgi:hypothetical protein
MKKLKHLILRALIRKSAYALPVIVSDPGEWTEEDEAWLRHVMGQRSGRKLYKLLVASCVSIAMDGNEKSQFENGKVAGAARVLQQILYLQGQPQLDEEPEPSDDSKTL